MGLFRRREVPETNEFYITGARNCGALIHRLDFIPVGNGHLYRINRHVEAVYDVPENANVREARNVPGLEGLRLGNESVYAVIKPRVRIMMEEIDFIPQVMLLINPKRVEERLMSENMPEEIKKHYIHYRMAQQNPVANTNLYVGSIRYDSREQEVCRAFCAEDLKIGEKYAQRENQRLDAEARARMDEKGWRKEYFDMQSQVYHELEKNHLKRIKMIKAINSKIEPKNIAPQEEQRQEKEREEK